MRIFLEIEVGEADIPEHVNVDNVPEGVRKQVERMLNEWQKPIEFTVSLSVDPDEAANQASNKGYDEGYAEALVQAGIA